MKRSSSSDCRCNVFWPKRPWDRSRGLPQMTIRDESQGKSFRGWPATPWNSSKLGPHYLCTGVYFVPMHLQRSSTMSNLTHHHNRLATEFSEHPVRSSATIGGFVLLTL